MLPLALSFVTFQQIAFLFDCYKRTKGELDENLHIDFVDYALFISFFPQLIAGPIVHHREMMPQFAKMGNSSLGMQFRTCEKFWESTDSSLVLSQNFSQIQKPHRKYFDCDSRCESATNQTQNKNNPSLREFTQCVESKQSTKSKNSPSLAEGARWWVDSTIHTQSTTINYEFLAKGIFIFSIGLFKKVFIADSFAKWANAGFGVVEQGGVLNIAESWATSLSYTFQLYFDFSGYCDMAMGLALMFGIVLPLNFDSPYKSLNIAEFWRRWHITLGRFLKECLYIPLGGNRVSKILNLRNLFIVAFLSGIWHGAGFGFIIWGILHGIAMMIHRIYSWILERLAKSIMRCHTERSEVSLQITQSRDSSLTSFAKNNKIKKTQNDNKILFSSNEKNQKFLHFTQTRLYKFLCWFITFNFINIAWIFFRSENLNGAVNLIKGMFGFTNVEIPHKWSKIFSALQGGTNEIIIWIVCAFIVCVACRNSNQIMQNVKIFHFIIAGFAFALCIFTMLSNTTYEAPFLYFNF